jgi:hypothetical protein
VFGHHQTCLGWAKKAVREKRRRQYKSSTASAITSMCTYNVIMVFLLCTQNDINVLNFIDKRKKKAVSRIKIYFNPYSLARAHIEVIVNHVK